MDNDLEKYFEALEAVELVDVVDNGAMWNRPRIFRERADHFERYDEVDFKMRYRLSKETVLFVLEKIEHILEFRDNR